MNRLIPFLLLLVPGLVVAQAGPAQFIGTDGNWFNPASWSTGLVPDADTDVLIEGDIEVWIDPAIGVMPVRVRDLAVIDDAVLRLLPGSRLEYQVLLIDDGLVEAFSSELSGDTFEMGSSRSGTEPGLKLQPTTNDNRSIKITAKTSVMHLGGLMPATAGSVGAGRYAVMRAEEIELGGRLQIELAHGFTPQAGQTFDIVQASTSFSGEFEGLPDGSVLGRFGEVDLRLEYHDDGVRLRGVGVVPAAVSVPSLGLWGRVLMIMIFGLAILTVLRQRDLASKGGLW